MLGVVLLVELFGLFDAGFGLVLLVFSCSLASKVGALLTVQVGLA